MKLIIVESPTKAKTIQGFLNKEYKVVFSKGHVMDLPSDSFGVDINNNFTPEYKILNKEVVRKLKEESNNAKEIFLATDPDREGEAIAYHIYLLIKKEIKRVLFYEITKNAVLEAISNPTSIDIAKVEAQIARRILDRIVGYKISPLLWKIFNKQDLSAGRVQSVALRLICEREEEIRNFKPQEYWEIKCKINPGSPFIVKLKDEVRNQEEAEKIESKLKQVNFIVKKFKKEPKEKKPPPPYITSTLQQEASSKLKFSTSKTMMIAQQLFEGITLGKEGSVGLITYMRTDSLRVAEHAIADARNYIEKTFGKEYLPKKPNIYEKKGTAGAHEAIRPTSVERTPESIKNYLTREQFLLYSLIYQRFLSSQMSNAKYEKRTAELEASGYKFLAHSEELKFDGFTKIYKIIEIKEEKIPDIKEGDELKLIEITKERKLTKPKPRYTEGTMVRELESKGIGRPSTYAPIISRIISKNYVKKVKGTLYPTELGEKISKILVANFSDIFNVNFTRSMEEDLDKIEAKEINHIIVLTNFYNKFKEEIIKFDSHIKEIKEKLVELTDEICPKCGKKLLIRWGPSGKFYACSGFPDCKFTKPLVDKTKEALTDKY